MATTRADSDGLIVAIRHVQAAWGWTSKEVARRISAVRLSKGASNAMDNSFCLEQLETWLANVGLHYTPSGLAFLVHQAGANMTQVQEQGRRMNMARFVYGIDRIKAPPVHF